MNGISQGIKGVLLLAAVVAGCVSAQGGTTIAYWPFEGSVATMGDDVSGNAHTLVDPSYTVQYSSTEYAPGAGSTGSAYFDGLSFLTTLASLDLTPYQGQNLRVSFWMNNRTPQDANAYGGLGTIYETGNNFKSRLGGVYVGVNGTYSDCSNCGMAGMMMPADTNSDQLPHTVYTGGPGVWEHYAIEFRPDNTNPANVTKVYKNGVLMPDTVVNGDHCTSNPNTFRNELLYLGMRKSAPQYSFTGKLDDVQIYDGQSNDLVAEWLFEDGAFLTDTSGNGNDLVMSGTYTGVTASTDVMSGHAGSSAAFDGNGQLITAATLNLVGYNKLRVKYRVKEDTPANTVGIFMEHSASAYTVAGGFVFSSEEVGGVGCAGIQFGPVPVAKTNRNIEQTNVTTGEWIEYDVTFDQTADNYEAVVLVTKNDVLQADNTIVDRRGVPAPWVTPMAYPNEVICIGGRSNYTLNFIGYVDEMKLEAFTDAAIDLPGDANRDSVVDDKDASILSAHWLTASGATWEDGDFNADGKVDDLDASILAAHWGQAAEVSPAVPEPGVLVLIAGGLVVLLARRLRTIR